MTSPRLILIESDQFFASLAIRHLRRAGFEVIHASHGEQGWNFLQNQPFDLVLTELVLPNMDGYTLLEAIRSEPNLQHLSISVLSRLGGREDVERCRQEGVHEYFIKPHHRLDWVATRLFDSYRQRAAQFAS